MPAFRSFTNDMMSSMMGSQDPIMDDPMYEAALDTIEQALAESGASDMDDLFFSNDTYLDDRLRSLIDSVPLE